VNISLPVVPPVGVVLPPAPVDVVLPVVPPAAVVPPVPETTVETVLPPVPGTVVLPPVPGTVAVELPPVPGTGVTAPPVAGTGIVPPVAIAPPVPGVVAGVLLPQPRAETATDTNNKEPTKVVLRIFIDILALVSVLGPSMKTASWVAVVTELGCGSVRRCAEKGIEVCTVLRVCVGSLSRIGSLPPLRARRVDP
jgi:hypothetical protein